MFMMNMEKNSAQMCESSCSLMQDDIFKTGADIIGGVDYLAMLRNFLGFHREDLVITDRLWTGESHGQQLPEQYNIAAALNEAYHHHVMEIPQILRSSLHYEWFENNLDPHSRSKLNSAFRNYREESRKGVQLCLAPTVKQKSLKRCFDFLRMMYKNSRDRSSWEADDGLVEESYAFTHKIAERNRRSRLSQQFLALRSLLPYNPKKVDKISTLSNAIMVLNHQKLRIEELEQLNQSLRNALTQETSESYSILAVSGKHTLLHCICEEAVVLVEETSIPGEAIIEVTLKTIASNSTHMDAIATVDKCLREMKLEVLRIQWRELESTNQLIEGTIRRKTKGERWEISERKEIKTAVKRALTAR